MPTAAVDATTPAGAVESSAPLLVLPKKPNFMCVEGKTFIVEQIDAAPEDMLKNIQEYYQNDLEVLKEQVQNHVSQESQHDLDAQVKRIERHLAHGVVTIPEDARTNGSTFILYQNKIWKAKIMLFKPGRISVALSYIADSILPWIERDISKRDAERFTKFCEWAKPLVATTRQTGVSLGGIKIDLIVNQDLIAEPMLVAFAQQPNLILAQPIGVHCHCFTGGSMCTGSVDANTFFNDPMFEDNFNSINPHSFANSAAPVAGMFRNMLRNQYFIEGRIRNAEVTAWRVS